MLSSIPAALQAVLWPLAGAVLVVALNRLLPNWLGRLLAAAASIACLVALASLSGQAWGGFRGTWEPFTFLRASPAVEPTALGLSGGMLLAAWSAAAALGVRGSQHPRTTWHGLNLVLLAGGVLMALAANLLTLVLGSALLDLALVLMTVSSVGGAGQGQRTSFRMCVPGLFSTGLLILAALRMDTDAGTVSISAQGFSAQVLALAAAAGLFRLAVFPLHPRGLNAAELAAGLVLSMGAGNLLLARVMNLGGTPAGSAWFLAIGAVALVAGGWSAWSAGSTRPVPGGWGETWSALAIQQAGMAVLFAYLFRGAAPWTLAGLVLAPGLLVLWWDSTQARPVGSESAWVGWARRQWLLLRGHSRALAGRLAAKRKSVPDEGPASTAALRRLPVLGGLKERWIRLRGGWLVRRGATLMPAVALASLAGVPFTTGGVIRWHLYGALLAGAHPLLLAGILASDAFLVGGLILTWKGILRQTDTPRRRWAAGGIMLLLAVCSITLWFWPDLWSRTDLPSLPGARVSVWGVGILFALPWLLGAWLAKVAGQVAGYLGRLRHAASLERVLLPVGWLGQKLLTAVYWLGSVGEGEGWWGWALIVLALSAVYLAAR